MGLVPKRRSAVVFDPPAGAKVAEMPMVVDAEESFYLKPEGRSLMASPCDETPAAPSDSRPEEIDVAVCIDRIERAFDLEIRRPKATWSGLRTFAADGDPVCGWDPVVRGFYWLAGQGGYGVQTAPALARIAADDILGRTGARRTRMERIDPDRLSPHRFNHNTTKTLARQGGWT
jgi:D-arginine dehydrogenase